MCGRFTLFSEFDEIIDRFEIDQMAIEDYSPSYNIAPSQYILAVINDGSHNRLGRYAVGIDSAVVKG